MRVLLTLSSIAVLLGSSLLAQQSAPRMPPAQPKTRMVDPVPVNRPVEIKSPEVSPDRRITFRLRDEHATTASVNLEGQANNLPMTKGSDGIWTATTEPMPPQVYGYRFVVDGEHVNDSKNADIRPNLLNPASVVHVPGETPEPWELTDVPHGEVHHDLYISKLATDEAGAHDRDTWIYTPPGYDPKRKQPYPVLYLLHGYSDGAEGWVMAGQANLILDNLIAQGKIQPMVMVMPRAYGTMRMIQQNWGVWSAPYTVPLENQRLFTEMMLKEILPMTEAHYNVAHDAGHRAIAGLSMGGGHSIVTGLNHPETFGYVGAFSSAIISPLEPSNHPKPGEISDALYQQAFSGIVPNAKSQSATKLFWISCGTEDGLYPVNEKFGAWAKENVKGKVSVNSTPGMHTWMVWRGNLISFSQLLWK